MKILKDEKGDIGVLFLILFLLFMIVIAVAIDATIMSKVQDKFNGTDATSNASVGLVKDRAWNAIDLSSILIPVSAALGFIIFIILWQRRTDGGQL